MTIQHFRGAALLPNGENGFRYETDTLITVQAGIIQTIEPTPNTCQIPFTYPNGLWLPGFVDSHVHFPQTRIIGSASGPLLPWLEHSVFPEESRFAEHSYAQIVAHEFIDKLITSGTTAAVVFGSSHPGSTDVLFAEAERRGIKLLAGMTLMNRHAPAALLRDTERAVDDSIRLIETWNNRDKGRLRYCITPRFAISCTSDLLRAASHLAAEHDLWIQSHLSENIDEINFTMELFPKHRDYLSVYNDFGLLNNRSIYAHCIHLRDEEWRDFIEAKAVVAHCPDSNFFLGSGCMPLQYASSLGAKISLGSDVGAGRAFSMQTITGRAYDASLMLNAPVKPEQLLYDCTIGAAKVLGFGNPMKIGGDADFSVVHLPSHVEPQNIIDSILFRHDQTSVLATYVRGKNLFTKGHE